jgi:hypothetical protein
MPSPKYSRRMAWSLFGMADYFICWVAMSGAFCVGLLLGAMLGANRDD